MSVSGSPSGFPELDKYELLEEIGHGGMATVYRARDLRLGREVAVKIIHKHLRENTEVRRRFVSEARAVAKLRHPSIVDVYDVSDEEDEERYLVVELVRGTTLRQLLSEREALPAEIAAIIVAQLCEAIEHAHACGVIHRDIKPENVLIGGPEGGRSAKGPPPSGGDDEANASSRRGSDRASSPSDVGRRSGEALRPPIKITDFGIAKILDTKGVTSTGQILGSPAHMAPEQIEGGEVGPHTDVFALGVLLYECMVGHLPFEGRNPAQVLRQVLDGCYEPPDAERPQVGGRWAGIVANALERDPAVRIGSAAELAAQLHTELAALGMGDADERLAAFFDDPEDCEAELAEQLVPRLLERGERGRQSGQAHEAAADFNRALAYRPDDLAILRRVSALTAHSLWKRRTIRLLAIAASCCVLGGGAFGLTRWLRPAPASNRALPMFSRVPVLPASSADEPGAGAASPTVLSIASAPPGREILGTRATVTRRVEAPAALRRVRFTLIPKGANLTLAGQSYGSPFGRVFELEPGPHPVSVKVPAGSKCCKPRQDTVTVQPAPEDNPESVQNIVLQLEVRPSTVTLVAAPAGARFTCPTISLSGAGGVPATVTLPAVVWTGFCEFAPGGKKSSVVLRAGQSNAIPWPAGNGSR